HEHRLLRRAVEDDADVRLAGDVGGGCHEHFLHGEILDLQLQDLRGELLRLGGSLRELDAARLAAAAGVHLRFHHDGAAILRRDLLRLFGRRRDVARRNRYAFLAEQFLCLILVNVHGFSSESVSRFVIVVPASPRTAACPSASDVMIARPPVRRTKSIAARILGAMLPSPNAFASSIRAASAAVNRRSGRCSGVPQSAYTASTSVRMISSFAPRSRASTAAARSLSTTASTPSHPNVGCS